MSKPIRILYVDDYAPDRELVRDALEIENEGFELVVAASRAELEANLDKGGFQLVLSDFNILGFEGLQVLEVVQGKDPKLPVIIVTGTGSEEVAAEAIKRGAADYILKTPQQIQRLPHTIKTVLENEHLKEVQRQTNEALRESEDKFKHIFEFSNIGNSITSLSGEMFLNRAFREMLGYSEEEAQGISWQKITYPDDMELTQLNLDSLILGKKGAGRITKRYLKKDGSVLWADVSSSLRRDKDGNPLYIMTSVVDVTERKLAEEELRKSHDLLENLASLVPGVIYQYRLYPDGKSAFPYSSPGMYDIYEVTPEEVREDATPVFGRLHPDDYDYVAKSIADSARTLGEFICDFRVVLPKQGLRWRWSQAHPERMPDGSTLWHGIISDVTDRKLAEQALRKSELRFRTLFEHAPVGVALIETKTGRYLDMNSKYCDFLGYTLEEIKNMTFHDVSHPGELQENLDRNNALVEGKISEFTLEKRFVCKDKTVKWGLLTASPLWGKEDSPAQYIHIAVVQDITYRKQAEAQLLASETRYRRLFEAARDGIIIINYETGLVVDVNPFLLEMLGVPDREIIGKELWELGFFKDIAANKSNFFELKDKGYVRYEDLPLETRDGRKFQVEFVSNVYQVNDYKVIQCNIRDITERKKAEDEIKRLNATLEKRVEERTVELREAQEKIVRQEKLAVLGQLAGGIGHELRNPLGVINNAIYYLKMIQPEANEKVKSYHSLVEQEVRTAEKIVGDLLDFAKNATTDAEWVSIPDLINRVLARTAVPESVQITLDIAKSLPAIKTDPLHLEQAMNNLITNACQAIVAREMDSSKIQHETGAVQISTRKIKEYVKIVVTDNGVGIAPENMKKIFEPLFTTKLKGIGLGLAVSKKLIQANGGQIEVASTPGKGSVFTITMPIKKPDQT